jgi:hypothetical protein
MQSGVRERRRRWWRRRRRRRRRHLGGRGSLGNPFAMILTAAGGEGEKKKGRTTGW